MAYLWQMQQNTSKEFNQVVWEIGGGKIYSRESTKSLRDEKIEGFHIFFRTFLREPRTITECTKEGFKKVILMVQIYHCKRDTSPYLPSTMEESLKLWEQGEKKHCHTQDTGENKWQLGGWSYNKNILLLREGGLACRVQGQSLERGITEESTLQDPGICYHSGVKLRLNMNKRKCLLPHPIDKLTSTK